MIVLPVWKSHGWLLWARTYKLFSIRLFAQETGIRCAVHSDRAASKKLQHHKLVR